MSDNFFGDEHFDRNAFLASFMRVHRLRPANREAADALGVALLDLARDSEDRAAFTATLNEVVLARNRAAVADADLPRDEQVVVREGADRRVFRVVVHNPPGRIRERAEADPYAGELELASESEDDEDDGDERKNEKKEAISKLREENEQRFVLIGNFKKYSKRIHLRLAF